ncbi:protein GAMETE EXPRESSED 3 [Setaria viridis]|uniref:protein GAMETE EXPRESSED 3 n=1 Tax=Setaria viridis TaxID=4556 RepID=UPI003B3A14E3
MAMGVPWALCLLACSLAGAARSEPPALQKLDAGSAAAGNARAPPRAARALSAPLIADDGRLVACSGKDLLAFERDGSIAWVAPLGHTGNTSVASDNQLCWAVQVYMVAEDKVIKVTPPNAHTAKPASEVFFSYNATPGRSEQIIGMSVSGSYSSLFLTIRNRGLFVFSLQGELQWSLGPVLDWFGHRLGCEGNVSGCYFDSAPVLDHSGGAIYILNTEGKLYSLYIQSRALRWIQDLSSLDKVMTVAPGNGGSLYVVFPRKSIVVGLDVSTGNISWQQTIGPLSNEKTLPTVDSNGWMSIGSLDGILYSISPDGDMRKFLEKTANDSAIHVDPVLDCSGFSMYVAKTIVEGKLIQTTGGYTSVSMMKPSRILVNLLAPAIGTIYWTGEYPGELSNLLSSRDLNDFVVDETILLTLLSAASKSLYCSEINTCKRKPSEHNLVLLLLLFQLIIIVIQAIAFCFCCVFWRKKKLQGNGLQKFLEKRRSLHIKKRALSKMISEVEQKAAEDATSNETLGELGEMVKAKEGVERKLYASYSLGRDKLGLKRSSSTLPLYHDKYRSHSFHSSQKESITVFNTLSDTSTSSTSEDGTSSYSDDSKSCSSTSSGDMDLDVRLKSVEEAGPSNTTSDAERVQEGCPSDVRSSYCVFTNPLYIEEQSAASSGNVLSQREEQIESVKDGIPIMRISLKRRRTRSSTN